MPKRTQEELAVLQELILSNLTNVRMIILYGSYDSDNPAQSFYYDTADGS